MPFFLLITSLLACLDGYTPAIDDGEFAEKWVLEGGEAVEEGDWTRKTDDDDDGFWLEDGDCDDQDPNVFPGAEEICDERDNNCDGNIDEGVGLTFWLDLDGDEYGDPEQEILACELKEGLSNLPLDCNDLDSNINPLAQEICNGIDEDCDGFIDENVGIEFYIDQDGDGYGDPREVIEACSVPAGYSENPNDCDDLTASTNPGADEICDEVDNNCNQSIDELAIDASLWHFDSDNDGYGGASTIESCQRPPGYTSAFDDCDDTNASINPNANEFCNGIDDNCNGVIDDNPTDGSPFYQDTDNDGFGNTNVVQSSCSQPNGFVSNGSDCEDNNPNINPNAIETCDGIDNDCDALVDDQDPSIDLSTAVTWHNDGDQDGFGNPNDAIDACTPPTGYIGDNSDCNDTDASIFPGQVETCDNQDNDCDGVIDNDAIDASDWFLDADSDGFGSLANVLIACQPPSGHVANALDCNDTDALVNPNAAEVCNQNDDDCDGSVDEDAIDRVVQYIDNDGDSYGNGEVLACPGAIGLADQNGDCDDSQPLINPEAAEICDGTDNDCDALVDDQDPSIDLSTAVTWHNDADQDGFGNPNDAVDACTPPTGYIGDNSDCNDTDASIFPGQVETCDNQDNDCDGNVDNDAIDASDWFLDADSDGFGSLANVLIACQPPSGHVANALDCNDTDALVNPNAAEVCNQNDDDCDGSVDEDAIDRVVQYIDNDGDSYGNGEALACPGAIGLADQNGDCDDSQPLINPEAAEICDGTDNDCDALVDDQDPSIDLSTQLSFNRDQDTDGYGDPLNITLACSLPVGFVSNGDDCNDSDSGINPDANEVCDNQDNDCDGGIDENASDALTWFVDNDLDGYGGTNTTQACEMPVGYSPQTGDCDDTDPSQNPLALEVCNGEDDDCDGAIDNNASDPQSWYLDGDGDTYGDPNVAVTACAPPNGFVGTNADCDDSNSAINPSGQEICDSEDNDCDALIDDQDPDLGGVIPSWSPDADQDGYGDAATSVFACLAPSGHIANSQDCDDTDPTINPTRTEFCDNKDNDCNGLVDDNASDAITYNRDADGDGFGGIQTTVSCQQPQGYVAGAGDCDDNDPNQNPSALEVCNNEDDDCNSLVDDNATDTTTWYPDSDGDAYGVLNGSIDACAQPQGFTDNAQDCDDSNPNRNPGEIEVCDGFDNDCDTLIDDLDPSLSGQTPNWREDNDGDGFGDPNLSIEQCAQPPGYVQNGLDCDDTNNAINPNALEICDLIDNDCDTLIDDLDNSLGGQVPIWQADVDGDGYGDAQNTTLRCNQPFGYVANDEDCDDSDNAINPDEEEVCDNKDNDCDGLIDDQDPSVVGQSDWYADFDNDGFGDANQIEFACDAPENYIFDNEDCNDNDPDINPLGIEECDGIDQDCDGQIDSASVCPCNFHSEFGSSYLFCETQLQWTTARFSCESTGYDLIRIDSEAENIWVDSIADSYSSNKWWIGLNDRDQEGTWEWSDGTPISYENWHPIEPNNSGGNEDCGQVNRYSDGLWNDEPCNTPFFFICSADP